MELSKSGWAVVGVAGEEFGEVGGFREAELARDGCSRVVGVDEEAFGFQDEPVGEDSLGGLASGLLTGAGDGTRQVAEVVGVVDDIVSVGEVGFDCVTEGHVYLGEASVDRVGASLIEECNEGVEDGDHEPAGGLVAVGAGLLASIRVSAIAAAVVSIQRIGRAGTRHLPVRVSRRIRRYR